jgi:hypothetical protein
MVFSPLCQGNGTRTHRLVFLHGLVMASAQFRPFRELVLRADAVHIALLFEDLALELLLLASFPGCWRRQSKV